MDAEKIETLKFSDFRFKLEEQWTSNKGFVAFRIIVKYKRMEIGTFEEEGNGGMPFFRASNGSHIFTDKIMSLESEICEWFDDKNIKDKYQSKYIVHYNPNELNEWGGKNIELRCCKQFNEIISIGKLKKTPEGMDILRRYRKEILDMGHVILNSNLKL